MRKTLGVAALMLAFCFPTLAGEIPNPPAPPPQPVVAVEEPTEAAQEPVTQATTEDGTQGTLTQIALDLLTLLPSLL